MSAQPSFRRAAGGAGARAEVVMWVLLLVAGGFAVVAALDLAAVLEIRAALPEPDLGRLAAGQGLGTAEALTFWGLVVAYVVWFTMSAYVVRGLRGDPREVLLTAPMVAWQVTAGVTLVAARLLPGANLMAGAAFGQRLRWMVPILGVRLVLVLLLVPLAVGLRRRVYATMLGSGVAPVRPKEERVTLLELTRRAGLVAAPLPVAGDAWWSEVADRVAAAGVPLSLREAVEGEDERVLLVAPGADLAELRGSLRPGATLTLLTDDDLTAVVPR